MNIGAENMGTVEYKYPGTNDCEYTVTRNDPSILIFSCFENRSALNLQPVFICILSSIFHFTTEEKQIWRSCWRNLSQSVWCVLVSFRTSSSSAAQTTNTSSTGSETPSPSASSGPAGAELLTSVNKHPCVQEDLTLASLKLMIFERFAVMETKRHKPDLISAGEPVQSSFYKWKLLSEFE